MPITFRQERAALKAQELLRGRCIMRRTIERADIRTLAGADAAYTDSIVCAAVVVFSYPDLGIIGHATAVTKTRFPYTPGFFAFREGPALLKAFRALDRLPDIAMCHGHGYAHPRRIGLASHIGVLLDLPTVGVAGRPMLGTYEEPAGIPGATEPLVSSGEQIGVAMRTREKSRPIIISPGHRTDFHLAEQIVYSSFKGGRMPLPLQEAHRCATTLRSCVLHET